MTNASADSSFALPDALPDAQAATSASAHSDAALGTAPSAAVKVKQASLADSRGSKRPVMVVPKPAVHSGSQPAKKPTTLSMPSIASRSAVAVAGSSSGSAAGVLAGYDFASEAAILSEFLDAGDAPIEGHPLAARYALYMDNSAELVRLESIEAQRNGRNGANHEVPTQEAVKLRAMGALVRTEEDSMELHTMEAMRMYLGVSAAANAQANFGVPGGVRAATALRQLFLLSQHNNPYSEWRLIQIDERMKSIKHLIDSTENKYRSLLDAMKVKGLNYSIIASVKTAAVRLGYHSPYGYAVSNMIMAFDYCVRVCKSAERRALATREQVRQALQRIKHEMRSMFEFAIKSARELTQPDVLGICRNDFFPDAAVVSVKRVGLANELFGAVPQEVFTGQRQPDHSLRYERVSGKEMEILRQIALAQDSGGIEPVSAQPVGGQLID